MPARSKALIDIDPSDIQALIEGEWAEDEVLEFKSTLSQSGSGNPDRWLVDQSEIGAAAKRDILAEVVAMANSYGGDVVLGIAEADEKPPRAVAINPLPKCVELASRLEHAARDLIKPQIPMLNVRGIPIDGDSGVVVFRVPQSRAAPHRLEIKGIEKECYRRVSDRSEPMTMREIQDLTFSVSRGLQRVDERLSGFSKEFEAWVNEPPERVYRCGYAVVATPISAELYFQKVHGNQLVTPVSLSFRVKTLERGRWLDFQTIRAPYDWRPILRGTQSVISSDHDHSILRRMYCDGTTLEFDRFGYQLGGQPAGPTVLYMYPDWIFTSVLNCFETMDRFRAATGAHGADYAVELIVAGRDPVEIRRIGSGFQLHDSIGTFQRGPRASHVIRLAAGKRGTTPCS